MEKIDCFMCGTKIKKRHPSIVEIKKYGKETLSSPATYLPIHSYFVCDNCANNLVGYMDEKYDEAFWGDK